MESLKSNMDFRNVYRNGKVCGSRYLVCYVLDREDQAPSRLGITVSKKVGNSVVRHRIKRLVKEVFRINRESFKAGLDIVIVARQEAKGRSYSEIESSVMHLSRKQDLFEAREQL